MAMEAGGGGGGVGADGGGVGALGIEVDVAEEEVEEVEVLFTVREDGFLVVDADELLEEDVAVLVLVEDPEEACVVVGALSDAEDPADSLIALEAVRKSG